MLRKTNDLLVEKDLKIKILTEQLRRQNKPTNASLVLFEKQAHHFESNELKRIRSMKSGQNNDSAFIYAIVKALYKGEEFKLPQRRASSRKYKGVSKHEISAEKKKVIHDMFQERISNEVGTHEIDELSTRANRLNELMRFGLNNATQLYKKSLVNSKCNTKLAIASTTATGTEAINTHSNSAYDPTQSDFLQNNTGEYIQQQILY